MLNPRDLGRFSYAPPIKLDVDGQWFKHMDLPGKGGGRNVKAANLKGISAGEAEKIRTILSTAKKQSADTLKESRKQLIKGGANVDRVLRIFIGESTDAMKGILLRKMDDELELMNKFKTSEMVIYQGGVSPKSADVIISTTDAAAQDLDQLGRSPIMTVYSSGFDKLIERTYKEGYPETKRNNLMTSIFIHEGYHATNSYTPDIKYPRMSGGNFDLQDIAKLPKPELRLGASNAENMQLANMNKQDFAAAMQAARDDVLANPDNFAYTVILLSYIEKYPTLFQRFVDNYDVWLNRMDSELLWEFPL